MLIGQIEQEILEAKYWNFWLQAHPDYFNPHHPIDLQPSGSVPRGCDAARNFLPILHSRSAPRMGQI